MKMIKKLVLLICILALTAAVTIAQEKRLSSAPASFRTFFASFKRAVVKGEKQKVASMTRFPFEYGFDVGDEGKMTKSQFIKKFRNIFGDDAGEFMTDKYLTYSRGDRGSYTVSNSSDASHLIFVKVRNTYKFTAYFSEP
jgi:hypothetical protein